MTWFRAILPAVSLLGLSASAWSDAPKPATPPPDDREQIIHVLNRITYGPRPGDVEKVQAMGLSNFIEQQLNPENIDDSAVEAELAQFGMLKLSQTELHQMYRGERLMNADKRDENIREQIAKENGGVAPPAKPKGTGRYAIDRQTMIDNAKTLIAAEGRTIMAVAQLQHAKLLRAVDSQRQLQEVLVDFWSNHFNVDIKKKPVSSYKIADDRDTIRPHILGSFRELLGATAKSPAMLVYLDNNRNSSPPAGSAPAASAPDSMMMGEDTSMMETSGKAQPHARKREKEKEKAMQAGGEMMDMQEKSPPKIRERGINENYAREIMELHTLGVDGGYSQKDVQEVARCFTGWTIDEFTGEFTFRPNFHDKGEKTVLGHQIPAGGGQKDAEMVMDILASHPATARHIARKLCQRFVSDDPSPQLVDRVAGVYTSTDGDLRAVTEAVLTSPEFLDPANYRTKIKSPLEFAVSAVRAANSSFEEPRNPGNPERAARSLRGLRSLESQAVMGQASAGDRYSAGKTQSLNWYVYTLGQPLFACTPPTGYTDYSARWVSPGALIERLNFAMALTEQRVADIDFTARNVIGDTDLDHPKAVLDQCVNTLLQGRISDATKKVVTEAALPADTAAMTETVNPNKLIALMIGSPEFQRK